VKELNTAILLLLLRFPGSSLNQKIGCSRAKLSVVTISLCRHVSAVRCCNLLYDLAQKRRRSAVKVSLHKPIDNPNHHKSISFVRNLSCLYCTQITLHVFSYTAILRCIMYIKMLKLLLKHNGSVNLLSDLTIIQVLYAKTIYKNYSLKTVKRNKISKTPV
jgi:hypothetical protein